MEKKSFLKKIEEKSGLIGLILMLLISFQTCNNSRKYDALKKSVDKIDGISQTALQIEGFKISKRMLYDNNAIIRTAVRPDDRMIQYDEEIKKLESK